MQKQLRDYQVRAILKIYPVTSFPSKQILHKICDQGFLACSSFLRIQLVTKRNYLKAECLNRPR